MTAKTLTSIALYVSSADFDKNGNPFLRCPSDIETPSENYRIRVIAKMDQFKAIKTLTRIAKKAQAMQVASKSNGDTLLFGVDISGFVVQNGFITLYDTSEISISEVSE